MFFNRRKRTKSDQAIREFQSYNKTIAFILKSQDIESLFDIASQGFIINMKSTHENDD